MISEKMMTRIATFIRDQIDHAKIVIDGEELDAEIIKVEMAPDNLIKVFVNTPRGKGMMTDLYLLDKDENVIVSKPKTIEKSVGYGLISSFYIKLIEREIENPANIFEMGRDR